MFGMRSVRIGRVFGIEIEIHASWLIVFMLVFVSLAFGEFPRARGATGPGAVDLVTGLVATLLFFGSVLAHELSHSLVGRSFGIEVKKITLFIFGGLAQMTEEARDPKSELFMAAAGPASSLVLSSVFGAAYVGLRAAGAAAALALPFFFLAEVNVLLAVFNLVPGFPLDGGRLFRAALWLFTEDMPKATRIATRVGQGFAGLLIASGALLVLAGPPDGRFSGFWLALIGLFLWNAATGSYQQVELGQALSGVTIRRIMTPQVITAPAGISVAELVEDYFMRYRHARFPLVDDGVLAGTVTLHDVRELDHDRWAYTPARDIASTASEEDFISPDEPALGALVRMARSGRGQLLVREDGRIVGIVTRSDVIGVIRIHDALRLG